LAAGVAKAAQKHRLSDQRKPRRLQPKAQRDTSVYFKFPPNINNYNDLFAALAQKNKDELRCQHSVGPPSRGGFPRLAVALESGAISIKTALGREGG